MIKIKNKNDQASTKDLNIVFKDGTGAPVFYLEDSMVTDITIKEENTFDSTFNKEFYDTDTSNRFIDIINFKPLFYDYRLRLIYDSVESNYFLTFNPDYIPLLNTENRVLPVFITTIRGNKTSPKFNNSRGSFVQLSHEVNGGSKLDVEIPTPDTTKITATDFGLYRLDLRGIMNPFKTRIRKMESNEIATYVETNEVYFLKMNKSKLFGKDTKLHLHHLLPITLNKFSVDYIGKVADIDYVYIPIQF